MKRLILALLAGAALAASSPAYAGPSRLSFWSTAPSLMVHRLPRALDQLATAFWQSTPMRFRVISLQTLLRRSRVLWRYPRYRFRGMH